MISDLGFPFAEVFAIEHGFPGFLISILCLGELEKSSESQVQKESDGSHGVGLGVLSGFNLGKKDELQCHEKDMVGIGLHDSRESVCTKKNYSTQSLFPPSRNMGIQVGNCFGDGQPEAPGGGDICC
jgi:hypothetical protein